MYTNALFDISKENAPQKQAIIYIPPLELQRELFGIACIEQHESKEIVVSSS